MIERPEKNGKRKFEEETGLKKFFLVLFAVLLVFPLMVPSIKAETVLTVKEAIEAFKNTGKVNAVVEGYIIGYTTGPSKYTNDSSKFADTNIAIADEPGETDPAKIMPVQLPPGEVRKAVNVKDHPEHVGKKVRLTGTLELYFSSPGLKSVTAYQFEGGQQEKVQDVQISPNGGTVDKGATVTLSTSTEGATIYYTLDGMTPTMQSLVYTAPFTISKDVVVKAMAVKEGLASSNITTAAFLVKNEKPVRIHDIQGTSHISPYEGKNVFDVEGVVTVVDNNGFYMQDIKPDEDMATSEAIYIFKRQSGVKPGDLVAVDGEVDEYVGAGYSDKMKTDLAGTQIKASRLTVKESNVVLPSSIVLGKDGLHIPSEIIDNDSFSVFDPSEDAIDFYESLEGMLVEVRKAVVAGPQKYGDVFVTVDNGTSELRTRGGTPILAAGDYNPERLSIKAGRTFVAKAGDFFKGNITGVVGYDYGNYRIIPIGQLPELQDGGLQRERSAIKPAIDKVTVATFNIENFSANPEQTSDEKVQGLAAAIIHNLNMPDIIAVQEMQDNNGTVNDGTTDASLSAKRLIDAIRANKGPGYKYVDVAPENNQDGGAPGANIRVGFLYNPTRVQFVQSADHKNLLPQNPMRIGTDNPLFNDTRKPLAAEFQFKGQNFVVISNHLNSKIGDATPFGKIQPIVLGSESKRVELATEVNCFMKNIVDTKKNAVVIAVGDMNDFQFSKPLQTLKGDIMTNMMETLPLETRYTYIHDGNAQVLDHILVTNNAALYTKVQPVHINAEFMYEHGKVSDHDPVVAQIDLKKVRKAS
ncbi:DUF6359 domain-containing protein [Ectobacillus antri]|uniref:DUF6359 domain-containing protein n=1 Tax=Ectobacillus antri TaxID=2486280 RepID=UPI00360F03F6